MSHHALLLLTIALAFFLYNRLVYVAVAIGIGAALYFDRPKPSDDAPSSPSTTEKEEVAAPAQDSVSTVTPEEHANQIAAGRSRASAQYRQHPKPEHSMH